MDRSYKCSFLQTLSSKPKELFYSFECLPEYHSNENLISVIESLKHIQPLFVSVPWHLKEQYSVANLVPLKTATMFQKHGLETLLHISATGLRKQNVLEILELAKEAGIHNILALRGDRTVNSSPSDFPYACDLVEFIREHFSDYFTIGVGGYPNGHTECKIYLDDLKYLKKKVDAGADFIITQVFFDSQDFIKFERDCREFGITVPIIPGVMPIQSHDLLEKMMKICQISVPEMILKEIKLIKSDEAVVNYGIRQAVDLIQNIIDHGTPIEAVHFFTMNRFHQCFAVKNKIEEINSKF